MWSLSMQHVLEALRVFGSGPCWRLMMPLPSHHRAQLAWAAESTLSTVDSAGDSAGHAGALPERLSFAI